MQPGGLAVGALAALLVVVTFTVADSLVWTAWAMPARWLGWWLSFMARPGSLKEAAGLGGTLFGLAWLAAIVFWVLVPNICIWECPPPNHVPASIALGAGLVVGPLAAWSLWGAVRRRQGGPRGRVHDPNGVAPRVEGHPRRWWILAVLCLGLVLVVMGNSVLNVALPTLQREFAATASDLQWIVASYALVFGAFLLLMGAAGDRFGRRGALALGLGVFGIASLASVFAARSEHLVAARAAMGLGGALVMPATLSILTTVFSAADRGKAIGVWAAFAGLGGALGPVVGGWLLEHFAWTSIFHLNLPIVVLALAGTYALVPTSKDSKDAPLDIVGAFLSVIALGALLFGIIEVPGAGWTAPRTLVAFGTAALAWPAFVLWELRARHPMLPMSYFRDRGFATGNLAVALAFFVMFAFFFIMTMYLQLVQFHSPFQAGLRTLPLAAGMVVAAPQSDRVARTFGTPRTVAAGLVLVAIMLAWFSLFDAATAYWQLAVTFGGLGVGMGLAMAPSTTIVMDAVPRDKAGVGSAMNDTSREVAGALGIAILGSVLSGAYAAAIDLPDGLTSAQAREASDSLGGALGSGASGDAAMQLLEAAQSAFVEAMSVAYLVGAGVALLAAILVATFMPRRHGGAAAPAQAPVLAPGATRGQGNARRANDPTMQARAAGDARTGPHAGRTQATHGQPLADLHARVDRLTSTYNVTTSRARSRPSARTSSK